MPDTENANCESPPAVLTSNKQSGLLGLSGISSDMSEIQKAAEEGNLRALITLKAYCYRVRKYIGAYVASMGGLQF